MAMSITKFLQSSAFSTSITIISTLLILIISLVYALQNKLIYVPYLPPGARDSVLTPSRFGMGKERQAAQEEDDDDWRWENVYYKSKDGIKLHAFWIRADPKVKETPFTIIFMHGNAGNIGMRLDIAEELQKTLHCNIFMLSYRGFGYSQGTPNEEGMKKDAQAALDYIYNEKLNSARQRSKVVAFGQSIGGAVAIHLTTNNPKRVNFLIVENTFLSLPKLLPSISPILGPFSVLCHQHWHNRKLMPYIQQPILFLSGSRDTLIPPSHMQSLHQLATRSRHRVMKSLPNGEHNDTCMQPGYYQAVREFLLAAPSRMAANAKVFVEEVTDEEA